MTLLHPLDGDSCRELLFIASLVVSKRYLLFLYCTVITFCFFQQGISIEKFLGYKRTELFLCLSFIQEPKNVCLISRQTYSAEYSQISRQNLRQP